MFSQRFVHSLSSVRRLAIGLLFAVIASPAMAQETLGQMTTSIYTTLIPAQTFLSVVVFSLGTWYVYKGVQMLRGTGEGGNQAPSIGQSIFKLGGGGALISLPFIINLVINSVTADSSGNAGDATTLVSQAPTFTDPGLDHALGRFIIDFFAPFMGSALPYFCYLAGSILMIRGIQRLANGDGKGPQAPGGLGTFSIFIVAAVLMSLGYLMKLLQGSIFGATDLYANIQLMDDSSPLSERAENVLWAIFQFLRIVGYISVIRGLFMLKANTDGGNVSMMGAITHIISGAMLANSWFFIWAVQNTFISDQSFFVFASPP